MANGMTIAKAYVQIIPSVDNIASNIKKALNDKDMTKTGEAVGNNLASGIKSAIVKAGIGVAIGKTIADAVKNGAEFEQLFGGAENIFAGFDTSQILQDSVEAYKTMGMSANEYLSVINDVGAGFKASMGSEAGYETAKKGLQAISDYATGTGKNINLLSQKFTMITRSTSSYQSIADQFSGVLPATSKAFLEQAQAAGDLNSEYTSLTQVPIAEYQSAVASALERGVDALNLTGNTAKEAEHTVSGAFTSMKASWDNFKTALTVPEIDADEAMQNLLDSIGYVIDAIVPMIERMAPSIANALADIITKLVPKLLEVIAKAIKEIAKSIPSMIGELDFGGAIVAIGAMILAFIELIITIKSATESVTEFNAMCAANPYALMAIAIGVATAAVVAFGLSLHDAYLESEAGQEFLSEWARISQGFEELGIKAGTLNDIISYCFASINRTLDAVGGVLKIIGIGFDELGQKIGGSFGDAIRSAGQKIFKLGDAMQEGLTAAIEQVTSWGVELSRKMVDTINDMITKVKTTLEAIKQKLAQAGQNMAQGLIDGFTSRFEALKNSAINTVEKLVESIKTILGIHSPSRVFRDEIGMQMAAGLSKGWELGMSKVNSDISADIQREYAFGNDSIIKAMSRQPSATTQTSTLASELAKAMKNVTVQNTVTLEGDAAKLFKSINTQNRTYKNITGRSAFA